MTGLPASQLVTHSRSGTVASPDAGCVAELVRFREGGTNCARQRSGATTPADCREPALARVSVKQSPRLRTHASSPQRCKRYVTSRADASRRSDAMHRRDRGASESSARMAFLRETIERGQRARVHVSPFTPARTLFV